MKDEWFESAETLATPSTASALNGTKTAPQRLKDKILDLVKPLM